MFFLLYDINWFGAVYAYKPQSYMYVTISNVHWIDLRNVFLWTPDSAALTVAIKTDVVKGGGDFIFVLDILL